MNRRRITAIKAALNAKRINLLCAEMGGNGHIRLTISDGQRVAKVTAAATPSCPRGDLNMASDARRSLRAA